MLRGDPDHIAGVRWVSRWRFSGATDRRRPSQSGDLHNASMRYVVPILTDLDRGTRTSVFRNGNGARFAYSDIPETGQPRIYKCMNLAPLMAPLTRFRDALAQQVWKCVRGTHQISNSVAFPAGGLNGGLQRVVPLHERCVKVVTMGGAVCGLS